MKGEPKCVLTPLQAEGGRDVHTTSELRQIHTVIQMAKNVKAISQISPLSKHNVRWKHLLKSTVAM